MPRHKFFSEAPDEKADTGFSRKSTQPLANSTTGRFRSGARWSGWRLLMQPRFLLVVWLGIGAAWLVIVLVAALFADAPRPVAAGDAAAGQERVKLTALLTGEVGAFTPAFPPRGAPQTRFDSPSGGMTLADFKGRPVLVNLWATWCAPCLEELPDLDRLQARYDKAAFEVLAIAADPRIGDTGPAFWSRLGITQLTLYRDESLKFSFSYGGANALPMSILYDATGREIGRLIGKADWSSPEAVALIDAVIARRVVF